MRVLYPGDDADGAGGLIEDAGIALAAVGAGVRSEDAERSLIGAEPSEEALAAAGALAAKASAPVSDQRGSAEYKRHVAGVLATRALTRAALRAMGKATPIAAGA